MGTPASVGVHCYIPEKLIAWNWNTVIAYSMLGTKWNNDQSGRIDGYWVCDAEPVFQTQQTCHICICHSDTFLFDLILARPLSSKLSPYLWQFLLPFSVYNRLWQKELFVDCYFKFAFNIFNFLKKICKQKQRHSFSEYMIIILRLIINNT